MTRMILLCTVMILCCTWSAHSSSQPRKKQSVEIDKSHSSPNLGRLKKGIRFTPLLMKLDKDSPISAKSAKKLVEGCYIEDVATPQKSVLLLVKTKKWCGNLGFELMRKNNIVLSYYRIEGSRGYSGSFFLVRLDLETPVFTTEGGYLRYKRENPKKPPVKGYEKRFVPLKITKLGGIFK